MNQTRSLRRFLIVCILISSALISVYCTRPAPSPEPVADIANPASVFCEQNGGRLDIRQDATGSSYGVCVFRDGSECEEWAFLRGECVPGGTETPVVEPTPVAEAPATATTAPPSPTPAPPTDTPVPPTSTPIPPTDTVVPDTATPLPTETLPPAEIESPTPMPEGLTSSQTSFTVQGHLGVNEIRDFPLSGREGQLLMLRLAASNPEAFLTLYAVGGNEPLAPVAPGSVQWHGLLPATQGYVIKAGSPGQATNFQLVVSMPQAIQFDPGAISATVQGQISAGEVVDYVLHAFGGQSMTARASSPKGDVLLIIYDLTNDEPLVDPIAATVDWEGRLPVEGDYLLKVIAGGAATDFALDVTIQ